MQYAATPLRTEAAAAAAAAACAVPSLSLCVAGFEDGRRLPAPVHVATVNWFNSKLYIDSDFITVNFVKV